MPTYTIPTPTPAKLRRAHRELDATVDRLYATCGFADDRARIEHLCGRYQRLIEPLRAATANRRTARRKKAAADA
ncbi:type IIL restriction-modification enzyme MmeI [uncultured Sphingomonas sp.]|uniref:type IIL restriction-modification enzyme MmeI n=1 Tax=uncultured Sphingomonas sp. TaxID=158754 RepID=UPI0035CC0DD0